jgi:ribosomal protein L11 methyltransferase
MPWQQLSVVSTKDFAPAIADTFSSLGAVSVTYMDAAEQPVYEPEPGETKIWQQTKVIALFELNIDLDVVESFLKSRFGENPVLHNWTQEILQDQVWERTWLEHFQPMKFGDKLWVCPTGQEQHSAATKCMILDPGLAFGTGTHPTTALCLEWLASYDIVDKTIIDYGCGSGILAISALLLGAKQAYAIDIDPQALIATQENAKKNQVEDKVNCYLPEQFPAIKADIVVANILAKPLIEFSKQISDLVAPNGHLILSGILKNQANSVAMAYANIMQLNPAVEKEEWCRLDGCKKTIPQYIHPS